jgi:prepilin-type processing-associated H-X9-DG protein
VEEMMPALPAELGGGPTTALTSGLRWISLGVQLPPDLSIHLTIRAKDAESAKALSGVVDTALKSLARFTEQEPGLSGLGKLAAALTPALSADHPDELVLSLDKAAVRKLVASELPDLLMKARAQAKAAQSMNNIRQLILGCLQYADAHKGDWPDDLEKAVKADDIGLEVLVNPNKPDSKPGYKYISPGKASEIKDYSSRLVVYETEASPAGRNVGFADGHVERVLGPEFQKYLKAAQEAAAKHGP